MCMCDVFLIFLIFPSSWMNALECSARERWQRPLAWDAPPLNPRAQLLFCLIPFLFSFLYFSFVKKLSGLILTHPQLPHVSVHTLFTRPSRKTRNLTFVFAWQLWSEHLRPSVRPSIRLFFCSQDEGCAYVVTWPNSTADGHPHSLKWKAAKGFFIIIGAML